MATTQKVKGILANAPVKLVVAQVRFERHPDIAESAFVTRFRELIGEEFTQIEQAKVQQITAGPLGVVTEMPESGWTLSTGDGVKISVLESSASLEVTQYSNWEAFRSKLDILLRAVEEIVRPATEQRAGLRYIDELDTEEGVRAGWKGYVRGELLGPVLHPDFGAFITTTEQRVVLTYSDGSTCLLRHGFSTASQLGGHYILDTDIFRTTKGAYHGDSMRTAFDAFHSKADEVFVGCLTSDFLEQLREGN